MSSRKFLPDLFDISCENYKLKIIYCFEDYNKMFFGRKKKLKECNENIQNYQYCLVDSNKNQLNYHERTSAVYENQIEIFDRHLQERTEDKIRQLEYLEKRKPDLAPNKTPTKYTVEL